MIHKSLLICFVWVYFFFSFQCIWIGCVKEYLILLHNVGFVHQILLLNDQTIQHINWVDVCDCLFPFTVFNQINTKCFLLQTFSCIMQSTTDKTTCTWSGFFSLPFNFPLPQSIAGLNPPPPNFFFLLLFSFFLSFILDYEGLAQEPSLAKLLKSTIPFTATIMKDKSITSCRCNFAHAQGCHSNKELNSMSSPNMLLMSRADELNSSTYKLIASLNFIDERKRKHNKYQNLFPASNPRIPPF